MSFQGLCLLVIWLVEQSSENVTGVKWLHVEPSTIDRLFYAKQWILSLVLMNMLAHISENQFR